MNYRKDGVLATNAYIDYNDAKTTTKIINFVCFPGRLAIRRILLKGIYPDEKVIPEIKKTNGK